MAKGDASKILAEYCFFEACKIAERNIFYVLFNLGKLQEYLSSAESHYRNYKDYKKGSSSE